MRRCLVVYNKQPQDRFLLQCSPSFFVFSLDVFPQSHTTEVTQQMNSCSTRLLLHTFVGFFFVRLWLSWKSMQKAARMRIEPWKATPCVANKIQPYIVCSRLRVNRAISKFDNESASAFELLLHFFFVHVHILSGKIGNEKICNLPAESRQEKEEMDKPNERVETDSNLNFSSPSSFYEFYSFIHASGVIEYAWCDQCDAPTPASTAIGSKQYTVYKSVSHAGTLTCTKIRTLFIRIFFFCSPCAQTMNFWALNWIRGCLLAASVHMYRRTAKKS